ncbi:MAG TPA: DUF3352 domain-containing protein [Blastocatellia bacterium]|nr:DUF3352 domain-containing protein [Blastocatellia bacterium]
MKNRKFSAVIVSLLTVLIALLPTTPIVSARSLVKPPTVFQQDPQDDQSDESIALEDLLASESYGIYVEVRDYGYQVKSGGITEILEPLQPFLGDAPKELVKFATFSMTNADLLQHSRVVFATEKAKQPLPEILVAIEMASASDAIDFQPKLKNFIISLLASTFSSLPGSAGQMSESQLAAMVPIVIKRAGKLLVISAQQFKIKDLRPDGSARLFDDVNFRNAHDHLATQALFVYADLGLMDKVSKQRQKETEAANKQVDESTKKAIQDEMDKAQAESGSTDQLPNKKAGKNRQSENNAENSTVKNKKQDSNNTGQNTGSTVTVRTGPPIPPKSGSGNATTDDADLSPADAQKVSDYANLFIRMMQGYGTVAKWPDSFAFGLSLNFNDIGLSLWIPNSPGSDVGLIPFIPLLIAGPTLSSDASNIFPSDTELLISASLDWPKMYDKFIEVIFTLSAEFPTEQKPKKANAAYVAPDAEVAAFEKKYGFKLRDELFSAIGNEISIGFSAKSFIDPVKSGKVPNFSIPPDAIFVISINDKDMLKKVLPKALEAFSLIESKDKPATEKYKDFDVTKYRGGALAIIDNYLVFSKDLASLHHVLDAKAKDDTLAANDRFNNAMKGLAQSRVGQVYVSEVVMKEAIAEVKKDNTSEDTDIKDFMTRFNPDPMPIMHAVSTDGVGTLHELHLPKNIIAMYAVSIIAGERRMKPFTNEFMAIANIREIYTAEQQRLIDKGSYAPLDTLISEKLVSDSSSSSENSGYKYEVKVTGNGLEITAVPVTYGKTGRRSFIMNEKGEIRGADHGGSPATMADPKAN